MEEQPLESPTMVRVTVLAEVALIPTAAIALGTTPKAIRRRIEDKVWREGREYYRRDGRIWIDLKGVARWVRGEEAAA
jgi:hypothetical protein